MLLKIVKIHSNHAPVRPDWGYDCDSTPLSGLVTAHKLDEDYSDDYLVEIRKSNRVQDVPSWFRPILALAREQKTEYVLFGEHGAKIPFLKEYFDD